MQVERDAIHDEVMPTVNEIALQYGDTVELVDLRWGINTSRMDAAAALKKVLSVCLDTIDRCRPFIVILLGNRFGTCPEPKLIQDALAEKNITLDDLHQSVTTLEIEYGALLKENRARCLVYCRELQTDIMSQENRQLYLSESPEDVAALEKLKQRLKMIFGERVKTYTPTQDITTGRIISVPDLTRQMTDDLHALLKADWEEHANQSRQMMLAANFSLIQEQKALIFQGRQAELDRIDRFLKSRDTMLIIRGESGIGKSALMASLAKRMKEPFYPVMYFCGADADAMNTKQMLQYLAGCLTGEDVLDESDDLNGQEYRTLLTKACTQFLHDRDQTLVLIIDAVDQLYRDETVTEFLWTPLISDQRLKIIISCTPDLPLHTPAEEMWLKPMNQQDMRTVVSAMLRYRAKEFDESVMQALLQKAENPLYLHIVVTRLLMLGQQDFTEIERMGKQSDSINEYLIGLIEALPTDLHSLSKVVIGAAVEKTESRCVAQALQLLAASRHGLRERDLESICTAAGIPWTGLDFAWLMRYLAGFFRRLSDGRVDFLHAAFRLGLAESGETKKNLARQIFAHLWSLDENDPVRMEEIVYTAYQADEKDRFYDIIADRMKQSNMDADNPHTVLICRDIKQIVLENPGFLAEILRMVRNRKKDQYLYAFMTFKMHYVFDQNTDQSVAYLPILETVVAHIDQEFDKADRNDGMLVLSWQWLSAFAHYSLGVFSNTARKKQQALESLKLGIERAEAMSGTVLSAQALNLLSDMQSMVGRIHEEAGDVTASSQSYRESTVIRERLAEFGALKDDTMLVSAQFNQAHTLIEHCAYDEAEALLKETLASHAMKTGDTRQMRVALLNELGNVYELRSEYDSALTQYQLALSIAQERLLESSGIEQMQAVSACHGYIGYMYELLGEYESALESFQKSLDLAQNIHQQSGVGESLRNVMLSQNDIAEVYEALHRAKEAEPLRRSSMDIATQLYRQTVTFNHTDDFAKALLLLSPYEEAEKAQVAIRYAIKLWEQLDKQEPKLIYRERIAFAQSTLKRREQ
jgi:tetratricopeptide (TPR) repeat protein